jgi:hypothetical protein
MKERREANRRAEAQGKLMGQIVATVSRAAEAKGLLDGVPRDHRPGIVYPFGHVLDGRNEDLWKSRGGEDP